MLNMWRSLARDGGSGGDIMMGLRKKKRKFGWHRFLSIWRMTMVRAQHWRVYKSSLSAVILLLGPTLYMFLLLYMQFKLQ